MVVNSVVALLAAIAGLWAGHAIRSRRAEDVELYRTAVQQIPGGFILLFDHRLRHALVAGRVLTEMGLSPGEIKGRRPREAFPRELCTVLEPAYRAALDGRTTVVELAYADRDYLCRVVPVRNAASRSASGLVIAQDITDRKAREYRLMERSSRDDLTGLWNRARFIQELDWMVGESRRRGDQSGCVLLIDLDGFKTVNDTLGHRAGDELLFFVAREIEARVRHSDTVARLGGDEFAVLVGGAGLLQAERIAAKIVSGIESVWLAGLAGGASVGIAPIEKGGGPAAEILSRADDAMYAAKRRRKLRRAS